MTCLALPRLVAPLHYGITTARTSLRDCHRHAPRLEGGQVNVRLRRTVPGGWYNDGKFVLSVGQSLTASDTQPVFLWFETDLNLTATVTAYRYVGDWVASRLQTRGQALFNRVQNCATSVNGVANAAYVEDLLRSVVGTSFCKSLLDDVLREQGIDPAFELPRAQRQVLQIAKPVLRDRLISIVAKILART